MSNNFKEFLEVVTSIKSPDQQIRTTNENKLMHLSQSNPDLFCQLCFEAMLSKEIRKETQLYLITILKQIIKPKTEMKDHIWKKLS